jgi:uncharacterized protein YcfJ
MTTALRTALAAAAFAIAAPAFAQATFYENDNFRGRSFTAERAEPSLSDRGFNDRASSIRIQGGRWQVCQDSGFSGPCVELQAGSYPSLRAMGLNDRVSSVRRIDDRDQRADGGDWHRRKGERLYEANVVAVRAVMGPPEQRCWTERQTVETDNRDARVPGAIIGGVIGGILGHQVGRGTGRDLATVGGVVAGAAIGSQAARNREGPVVSTQDVRRCADTPGSARTDYWDVVYNFRGQDHRVQMSAPPGPTVTVNRQGEPRA